MGGSIFLRKNGSAYYLQKTIVLQYHKKRPALPKCPMTGVKLKGVKPTRPADRKRLSLRHKNVFRAYGGVLSHKAVREKIVRAFLIEEQKLVNLLMRDQQGPKAGKE